MSFNFPQSPTIGQESVQNGRTYKWTGYAWEIISNYIDLRPPLPTIANSGDNRLLTSTGTNFGINAESNLTFDGSTLNVNGSGNFNYLSVNGTPVSIFGHQHLSSSITDFNSGVSGLLPIKKILSGSGISITNVGPDFTVSVTGQFGLTSEQVDDRISNLLTAGNYINLNYNDSLDSLIISVTGVQSSGNYSVVGHSHIISDVSGLQNALDSKQPSGNYASSVHDHTSSQITDFNTSVSGLLTPYATINSPSFSGTPTAPTAPSGTNNSQIANTQFVRTEISNLVNSAPSTLDTLNELAVALGNDPNFATTMTNSLANKANLSGASFSGTISAPSGDFNVLRQSGVSVSVSGHSHSYSDITNFASGIDANVTTLLNEGSYIDLSYDTINDILTISATGLQPSGDYSIVGHSHIASNITDFNSSVSGLLPVKNIIGSGYVNVSAVSGNYTVSVSGLQPSGSYSLTGHSHTSSDITNFNTSVSGLLPSISGSGYVSSNFTNNIYTISVSGLQPSGDYSLVGHTHTASNISDFNSSVSGLLPVKDIVSGTGISVSSSSGIYTINSTVNEVAQAASLVTTVFNKTGSPIPKMSVVYINGGQGDLPTISLAAASGEMTSSKTYGITYENISNMSSGRVIVAGAITGLNTDQFNPTAPTGDVNGSILWLSPTIPGSMTTTKPSAPYHMVAVGTVVRTHQNEGVIEVRIQNGFELEELHNVAVSGVLDGQFLQYNSSSSLWTPSSSGNFSSLQVNGTGVSLSGHSHSSSDITNFSSGVSGLLPTNIVTGIGVSGYLTKWTDPNIVSSGIVYDTGSRVGINTSSPSGVFHVVENINSLSYSIFENSNTASINARPAIALVTNYNNQKASGIIASDWTGEGFIFQASRDLADNQGGFVWKNNAGSTTHMVLRTNGSGKLGLGTSTPLQKFDVRGNIYTSGSIGVNATSPSGALHVVGSGLIASVTGTVPNSLLHVYSATSGASIFNVEGTNGSLFSVDDNLSGTLMSVNNNAGLPVFEVFSDDRVVAGRFNQNDFVINSSGNIGIGNSGDNNYKINIVGNANVSGVLSVSGIPLSEIIDDEVSTLLTAGSGISLSYNDTNNLLTISTSGLQPSGNYSLVGHSHISSDITDFNSSVSGLLSVTNILGGSNITVSQSGTIYTVAVTGSLGLTTEEVDDRVSNLLVAGSGISLDYNDGSDTLTIHNTSISPDEIEEYTVYTNLPASGNINILYRTTDDGRLYQWSGGFYAEVGPDSITTGSHASQHYTNGADPILNVVSRPATLTANVNNYVHNNADIIYLDADANRVMTGLASSVDGTVKLLINKSLYTITLDHQDTNSNPENRFLVPFGSDYVLQAGYSITVVYDSDALRWRVLA